MMSSPQFSSSLQNSSPKAAESHFMTPKAPNLRPCESPDIEFEDFLLPEPLLGEETMIEEEDCEDFEDFLLEDAPSKDTLEEESRDLKEEVGTHAMMRNGKQGGRVERSCKRSAMMNPGNEVNFDRLEGSAYQMSKISGNCSTEGVVELILRKKSISI